VYSDVCLSYRGWGILLYTMMCLPELEGEENVTVYNDVCLRCRLREMLLYTMMCV